MPTLLAIETSSDACSAAICHNNVIQENLVVRPREHNKIILPLIDELLKSLKLTMTDLDAIAFGAGPGSFTGLRLSAGIVQGLAFAAQKPVIPVSSLAAMALSAAEQINAPASQIILTILDARMQDVYFGAYQYQQACESTVIALDSDKLLPVSQLDGQLGNYKNAVIIGDSLVANALPCYPHARAVLALAKKQFDNGNTVTAEQALPVYLRDSVSWQKWQPKSRRDATVTGSNE